jgi:hypothetical protein
MIPVTVAGGGRRMGTGRYRIVVRGGLNDRFSDAFGGLELVRVEPLTPTP